MAILLYLLVFVIPNFEDKYKSLGVALPISTTILLAVSKSLRQWWGAWLLIAALCAVALKKARPGRPLPRIPDFAWALGVGCIVLFIVFALFKPMAEFMYKLP